MTTSYAAWQAFTFGPRRGLNKRYQCSAERLNSTPALAAAYGMAARCYSQRKSSGWMVDHAQEIAEAERLGRRAAELGRDDAVALCTAGIALGYVVGDLDTGADLTDQAVGLNPNFASAWLFSGWVKVLLGEPEVALQHVASAMRLSPHDPQIFNMQAATASAHFFAGRYSEALSFAEMALRGSPYYLMPAAMAAASRALTGRLAEAQRALVRLREIDPALRLSNLHKFFPLCRPEDFNRLAEGLRKAGLPE
jgi:tetratricopeptide (TPR) repeat protein